MYCTVCKLGPTTAQSPSTAHSLTQSSLQGPLITTGPLSFTSTCSRKAKDQPQRPQARGLSLIGTLIKKKIKFSSYIRKFRMKQLQSHIWLTASSYMGKYLRISSYIRKPFLIYDIAIAPLWISLYMRNFWFSFLSVHLAPSCNRHASQSSAQLQAPFYSNCWI